ncbi:MAG: hypothetical protein AAFO70_07160 [Pseudomonadota bacterium]
MTVALAIGLTAWWDHAACAVELANEPPNPRLPNFCGPLWLLGIGPVFTILGIGRLLVFLWRRNQP